MNIKHSEENYKNFGKCLKINNGFVEIIVTLDIGPRIISYRLLDSENIFFEDIDRELITQHEEMDKMFYKDAKWLGLGGHRLWRAPESYSTYYPETNPVTYIVDNHKYQFIQEIQKFNDVQLIMDISFLSENEVVFEGTIFNRSNQEKELSSWSLSMCKGPGLEIIKLPQEKSGFTPQRIYTFWDFGAEMNDPRAFYGKDYFALKMEPGNMNAYKVGLKVNEGKILYLTDQLALVKKFKRQASEIYPDHHVNYETYTKDLFLEIETLSPLKKLKPNESVTQKEIWSLYPFNDKLPKELKEEELRVLFHKYIK